MRMSMSESFTYQGGSYPAGDYDVVPFVKDGVLTLVLRRVR